MAVINCPACKGKVSTEAAACPHCGHPQSKQPAPAKKQSCGGCVGTIIAFMIFAAFIGAMAPKKPNPKMAVPLELRRKTLTMLKKELKAENYPVVITKARTFINNYGNLKDKRFREILDEATVKQKIIHGKNQTVKINKILKTVPEEDFARREQLYKKLTALNPQNKEYKDKYQFYRTKMNAGKIKELIASVATLTSIEAKLQVYRKIVNLDPNNAVYKDKVDHFKKELNQENLAITAAKTKPIIEQLKTIPVKEYNKNLELYKKLIKIDPSEEKYAIKIKFYEGKIAAAKRAAIAAKEARAPKYTIIKDKAFINIKRSVDVRISRITSKEELTEITTKILKMDHRSFERTFITYFLPGMVPGNGLWARSHFERNLSITINLTPEDLSKLITTSKGIKGEIIGQWVDCTLSPGWLFTIYSRENQHLVTVNYGGTGNSPEKPLTLKITPNGKKFSVKDDVDGLFYLLTKNGDLEMGDSEGIFEQYLQLSSFK